MIAGFHRRVESTKERETESMENEAEGHGPDTQKDSPRVGAKERVDQNARS